MAGRRGQPAARRIYIPGPWYTSAPVCLCDIYGDGDTLPLTPRPEEAPMKYDESITP